MGSVRTLVSYYKILFDEPKEARIELLTSKYSEQSNRLKRLIFPVVLRCCIVLLCLVPGLSLASSVSSSVIDDAVTYLISQQNPDGSWSEGDKRVVDTIEVIKALGPLSDRSDVLDVINESLQFIVAIDETNNDILARKFLVLANSTADTNTIKSVLLAGQNEDGGWGLGGKKQSDVLDTIVVAEALLQDDSISTSVLSDARDFIINSQQYPSGCWIFADEEAPSDIGRTAMGLIALKDIERVGLANSPLAKAVTLAQDFLENQGEPNDPNGWLGTCADTVLAYRALLRVRQPYDVREYLEQLLTRQLSNGSWEDDVFTTALVLQALNAVSPPELPDIADLAVYGNYIQFNPSYPNTGQAVTITAQVKNKGTVSATGFYVEFYNGDPNSGGELIGAPYYLDGIAPGSTAGANAGYSADDTSDLYDEQLIVVVVDPNDDVTESYYNNNFAYRTLTFGGGIPDINIAAGDIYFYDIDGNDLSGDPNAYEPIAIVAEVINLGAGFSEPFDVNFEDTADANFSGKVTFENGLAHGQKAIATFITGLPQGSPRTIKITADPNSGADPNGAIDESDESNNSAVKDVNVAVGNEPTNTADLKVEVADINLSDPNAEPGETITITFTIHNTGSTASGDFYVIVTDGSPYVDGYYLIQDNISVDSIAVGGDATKSISYTVQYREGGNEIFVLADRSWVVTESNKSNNIASRKMQVAQVPDLTSSPESIRVSHTNLVTSRNVQVFSAVRNLGGKDATNVSVKFATWSAAEPNTYYVFGEDVIASIPAYGTAEADTIWHPDANTYTVCALIDFDNTIPESDENNNIIKKSSVTFSYSAGDPNISLYLGGSEQYTFGAFDRVEIRVILDPNYRDANDFWAYVWVERPDGEYLWPYKGYEGESDSWHFNTGTLTPGSGYTVGLEVIDLYTLNIVQQDAEEFTIVSDREISTPLIRTEQRYLQLGSPDVSLAPAVSMYSWSNQDITDANIVVTLYGPNDPNNVLYTWSEGVYLLEPGDLLELELAAYNGIAQSGDYNIVVEVFYDHNGVSYSEKVTNNKIIPVIPALGFSVFKSLSPEVLAPVDHAKVDVRVDLISSGTPPEAQLLDVVLIIDRSGSMGQISDGSGVPKIDAAKAAAKDFVEMTLDANSDHQVGLVSFGYDAFGYDADELLELKGAVDINEILSKIDSIEALDFQTNITAGIDTAIFTLSKTSLDRKRIAILLTDGEHNAGAPLPSSAAITAAENDITIITVGLIWDCEWYAYDQMECEKYGNCEDLLAYCENVNAPLINTLANVANNTGGSFYRATSSTVAEIYEEIYEEITTIGVENIYVVDKVNYEPNKIELDIYSIDPMPTYILEPEANDANYIIRWDLPSMEVDESASFGYQVDLFDLEPGETRVVNKLLNVTAYNSQAQEALNLEIGPQSISVTGVAVLGIQTDKQEYIPGELAELTVTFQVPDAIEHTLITTQEDFLNGKPNGVDANTSPGNLILAKNGDNYYSEGTLGLIIDAGSGSYWGNIDFTGDYPDDSMLFERTNNYLRSNLVHDVYLYDRSNEGGGWWSNSSASWYAEANDTIVDHALITDEGWIVSVPVTGGLDAAMDSNDFTIEGWLSADTNGIMFYRGDGDANYLCIYKQDVGGADKLFVDYESPTDSSSRSVVLSGDSNAWHYVALTVSGSTATLYVDGNDVNDSWTYNTSDVFGILEGKSILIGGEPNSSDPNHYVTYPCRVDEVSIYNRVLDANDIGRHLDDNLAHEPAGDSNGLVGYWNFDPSPQDQSGLALGGTFVRVDSANGSLRRITGRSSEPDFPQKSYIVATTSSIDIIDAESDMLWMRFLTDRKFLWDTTKASPSSLFALDGKIYVGQDGSAEGLAIIDFAQDDIRVIKTGGVYKPSDPNIDKRFDTDHTFSSAGAAPSLRNGYVHDVMAVEISDVNYIAVGTREGLTLIEGENTAYDSNCSAWVSHVFLTDNNDLYFTTSANEDSLYAVYNINNNITTDNFEPNTIYGYGDQNEPNFLENKINDLFVTAGSSTEAAGDNTLYVATARGLVQIQENQGDKSSGVRKIYLSSDCNDFVNILAGDSNNVTAVYADANEIWVGTSEGLSSVGTLSIIDPGDDDKLREKLTAGSTPRLPMGMINALARGLVGTSGGVLTFEPSSIAGEPVSIRARCIYTDDLNDPNEAVSEWTEWTTKSGTSIMDTPLSDPNSRKVLGRSQYLELEVKLTRGSNDTTPVLEWISVGYTPDELAIDVTIEDAQANKVPGYIALIRITDDHMAGDNLFYRHFDTTDAIPGDYNAVATLIDLIDGEELQRATDDFVIKDVEPSTIYTIVNGSITTDKRFYYGGELMTITSTVINESNSVPVDGLDVKVELMDPYYNTVDLLPNDPLKKTFTYTIYSLQPGAVDVKKFYFTVDTELSPEPDYVVEQVVSLNSQSLPANRALFEIKSNCENLTALSGTLTVHPPLVRAGTSVLDIGVTATNTGNVNLNDVTLLVRVNENPGEPNTVKTFEQYVPRLDMAAQVSFNFYYIPVDLEPNTYPVVLSAAFKCGDSNETTDLALSGFTVIDEVSSTVGEYVIIDLGTIENSNSYAYAVNNYGNVTGYVNIDNNSHTFLWKCGEMVDLDPNGEFNNSVGWGINDSEQIAGYYYSTSPSVDANAFIWQDHSFADPGTGPNGSYPVEARAININGRVTGKYTLSTGGSRAFVWHNPPDGNSYWDDLSDSGIFDANSFAFGINNSGDLAGYWEDGADKRTFVRRNGVIIDAGQYKGTDTYLRAINEYGQAAGYSDDVNDTAILYENGIMMALESPNSVESRAYGINAAGEVVGTYKDDSDWKAFIWRAGKMHELKDRLALQSQDENWWDLTDAYAINNEGQIVGFGAIEGKTHAFRLDPLPFAVTEPNLVLWLRADTGVVKDTSNLVSRWIDQSFNGNDVNAPDVSSQPLLISNTPCCDPVISFDGDDVLSTTLDTAYDGNSTIFMVVITSSVETGTLFASEDGNSEPNAFEIKLDANDLQLSAGTPHNISPAATEAVILEVVIDGTKVSFYKNGRWLSTDTIGATEAKRYTHYVLGKGRGGGFMEYDVAEVLVFAGALSDANRAAVEDYLISKHKLFGPADMSNPKLWFKADTGVTMDSNSLISKWADQSGNGYDAVQDNDSGKPEWESGAIDCQPAVWFDGAARMDPNIGLPGYFGLGGVICIDRSRSMGDPDANDPNITRFRAAQNAAIAMLEEIRDDNEPNDYVALVEFVGNASVVRHFTTDMNQVIADVNGLSLRNGNATNFKSPLDRSRYEFEDHEFANQTKRIILVTDGQGNSNFNAVYDAADRCIAAGIVIHTIFMPLDSDSYIPESRQVLQDIADSSGGTYHEVNESSQLSSIFLEILGIIKASSYDRTLSMVFKTGSDVLTRQVLFAQGDPNAGLNIYIDANELYFGIWDLEGKSGTAWGPSYIHTTIEPNQEYLATFIYTYDDGIQGYLYGSAFDDPNTTAGKLDAYEPNHSLGSNNRKTLFHDGNDTSDNYYVGYIAELLYYDSALSKTKREGVELYLAERYGFDIERNLPPIADADSDFTVADHNWDGSADVNLSGGAYDDKDPNLCTYEWYEDGILIATGPNPTVELDVGTHTLELRVTDENGLTSIDTIVVTVTSVLSGLESASLVGNWKFDEDANDSSGNDFNANVVNAPELNCWVEGRVDGAIKLNADSNEYVDLNPDGNSVKYFPGGTAGRTIMGWFEAGDNENPTFFDYGTVDANTPGTRFAVTASSTRLAVTLGSHSHVMGTESFSSLTGWHHIAVVFPDGAERSNQVNIFLDGVKQVLYTLDDSGEPVIVNTNTWDTSAYGYIGRDCDGNYFNGGIDDVRLYARGLRDSEIPVIRATQTRYHVIDLGPLETSENPQASRARVINNQGNVVGTTTIFLEPNTPCYWRIDEKNECGVTTGDTWNFTTGSGSD